MYVPEKRDALTRWVQRLTEILGHEPNDIMKAHRAGYQGQGPARKLGRRETYEERKARLGAQGRDLRAERRRRRRREATPADPAVPSDPFSPRSTVSGPCFAPAFPEPGRAL